MIWAHLIFRHVTFSMPHWGIFPILIEIYRSPLVYMIIHGYEIHARLMIDFILSWYFEELLLSRSTRFLLFDIVVVLGRSYVECLDSHVIISVRYTSGLLRIPMALFSSHQGRSDTSDAILGHISLYRSWGSRVLILIWRDVCRDDDIFAILTMIP